MYKTTTLGILAVATLAIAMALTLNTIIVKQVFAVGGSCVHCAKTFAPGTNDLILPPGQTIGSATDVSPGHLKLTTPT